ncbi:MAG: hypothetical protein IPL46_23605, partial [Saprospiraceae bacterium]|nr:hypothetical protein [Saprospiraceae bacterium]
NSLNDFPNHGYFSVNDENGTQKAGAYVNSMGQGVVFADVMAFASPSNSRSSGKILYSTVQGAEVAVYHRGTGTLENGKCEIILPGHFRELAEITGMTVQTTSLSAETFGIAVVEKTSSGFKVKELMGGTGNFL